MTKNKSYNSVSLLCVNNKKKEIKGDQIGREFSKYTNRNNCLESFNLTYQLTSCSCLFCMYNKASLYWDISCFLSPYGCCEALDGKMHGLMIYEIGVCFFYLYWCGFWSKPFFFHFIVLVNTFLPLRILMHICVGTLSFPKVFLLLYACKEGNTRLMH